MEYRKDDNTHQGSTRSVALLHPHPGIPQSGCYTPRWNSGTGVLWGTLFSTITSIAMNTLPLISVVLKTSSIIEWISILSFLTNTLVISSGFWKSGKISILNMWTRGTDCILDVWTIQVWTWFHHWIIPRASHSWPEHLLICPGVQNLCQISLLNTWTNPLLDAWTYWNRWSLFHLPSLLTKNTIVDNWPFSDLTLVFIYL